MRVVLWRAMHVQVDSPPHVFEDEIGLRPAAPDDGWRRRPDMDPLTTSGFRAAVVARARFIEDLVIEQTGQGVDQYVVLGAGLDTLVQRRPEITPQEMLALAHEAGLADARHVPGSLLAEHYFADRADGLRPSSGEDLLLATV